MGRLCHCSRRTACSLSLLFAS
ncbi:hypothetical protein EH171_05875 [Enterovibrio baiacu]|nr:hypothetical protein [Enterovibrio baiacu]